MDRRQFLLTSASATAALAIGGPTLAAEGRQRFGIQLFSLPKLLQADVRKAIALLAQMGYREVEPYGPYSFSAPEALARWKTVSPSLGFTGSGYFGLSGPEFKALLASHGMTAPSMHTDFATLDKNMRQLGEAGRELGFTYVGLPSIPEDRRKTLDAYKRMADTFNRIGKEAKAAGVRFAYHNHGYGLQPMEGVIPVEYLLANTDPDLVFFEMDLYWTLAGGADPIEYLRKYPGRYRLMHVKDMQGRRRFSGDGGNSTQWIELFPYMVSAGDGSLDLKAVIEQGRKSGVEHFFVEQDNVANPEVALKKSIDHLTRL
jgi:sugar phosphate isomerase/epimerase